MMSARKVRILGRYLDKELDRRSGHIARRRIYVCFVLLTFFGHLEKHIAATVHSELNARAGTAIAATVHMSSALSSLDAQNVSYIQILHTGVQADTATITLVGGQLWSPNQGATLHADSQKVQRQVR